MSLLALARPMVSPGLSPARWGIGLTDCGHLESCVCTGISVSGINRKRSLAVRFLPAFFNKPRYIFEGILPKMRSFIFTATGRIFVCDIPSPPSGKGRWRREAGCPPWGLPSAAGPTHWLNTEQWLLPWLTHQ